jgi:hypothetical protein
MQPTTFFVVLSFASAALGAAVPDFVLGLRIRKPGEPVAASLRITQRAIEPIAARDLEK